VLLVRNELNISAGENCGNRQLHTWIIGHFGPLSATCCDFS
jgi:hypothetical protein